MPRTQSSAEDRLEQLERAGEFPPPPNFAEHAQVRDGGIYDKAAADPTAWWAGQARQRLDWQTPFGSALTAENREPGDATTLAGPSVMDLVQRATTRSSK
jgi:hypothetical protein